MPLFRKKSVVIEAIQYEGGEPSIELRKFLPERGWAYATGRYVNATPEKGFMISTVEGWLHASPGDWIIKGVKGEFYPCKPDIFRETYEEIKPIERLPV